MIRLSAETDKECFVEQKVIYDEEEKGFISEQSTSVCISLLAAYVEVQFDSDDMCAKGVCGLAPKNAWRAAKLSKPEKVLKCGLKLEESFEWGVYRVDADNEWQMFYDENEKIICIGKTNIDVGDTNINFISNVTATVNERGNLKALWIDLATNL